MEFVAADERAAVAEHARGQEPRGAVAEMQLTLGEARPMAE